MNFASPSPRIPIETLTEIAYRTSYNSVQHLSNQFRQQTDLTPSYFRQARQQKQPLQQEAIQTTCTQAA